VTSRLLRLVGVLGHRHGVSPGRATSDSGSSALAVLGERAELRPTSGCWAVLPEEGLLEDLAQRGPEDVPAAREAPHGLVDRAAVGSAPVAEAADIGRILHREPLKVYLVDLTLIRM
jgi:hypothetical protein